MRVVVKLFLELLYYKLFMFYRKFLLALPLTRFYFWKNDLESKRNLIQIIYLKYFGNCDEKVKMHSKGLLKRVNSRK